MAVFTHLDSTDTEAACLAWDLGRLREVSPTPLGIENSNFFLTTEKDGQQSQWVLTLGEQDFLPTTLELLVVLDAAGLPVPVPQVNVEGSRVATIAGRPALLAPRFPGSHPDYPTTAQCAAVGRFLGRMHVAAADLAAPAHPRDHDWIMARAAEQRARLGGPGQQRLATACAVINALDIRRDWQALPSGVVHGDLFRDNVLFDRGGLCGVIDFHHAARAPLLFDLAVCANDWCSQADGRLDGDRLRALLRAYGTLRPLTMLERWFWPGMTVLAALRFWLARLEVPRKPPVEMARILDWRLREGVPLAADV